MENVNSFADRLAQAQQKPGIISRLEPEIITPPNTLSFAELMQLVKEKKLVVLDPLVIDLSTAQNTPKQIFGAGLGIYVLTASDDTASINLRFNSETDAPAPFVKDYGIMAPFSGVFATWSAQAGKTITLIRIPASELVKVLDNRKVSAISSITLVGQVTTIPGLNALPSGATVVSGRHLSDTGAGSTDVYTVTAGKTLHILCAGVSQGSNNLSQLSELIHADAGGTLVKPLVMTGFNTVNGTVQAGTFLSFPGVKPTIPAGEKVRFRKRTTADADGTSPTSLAWFVGYEV
ncbi:MAG: hypothetical protein FMNOHCHN_03652 [Ignavibacteriaceae bacterium]|nr:hypothetical protein [Ignavibacteriaceae bacterium]